MTSDSLWNCFIDKVDDDENENDDNQNTINNNKTTTSKFFDNKTKIIGSTPNNNNILNAKVVVPLKDLSNFWRSLDLPLVNCETEIDLRWTKNCVISEILRTFTSVD